jgi:hypothetical protein
MVRGVRNALSAPADGIEPNGNRPTKGADDKPAQRAGRRAQSKRGPWNFPKNSLEESIKIAQAIEEKNAGKPLDAATLAKYVGFRKTGDWRYQDLLLSASRYGLVNGTGTKATVSLSKFGEEIVAPSSPSQRQQALSEAFDNVELFKKVAEYYKGKTIPEDEYFANTLVREFDVPRERVDHFIKVFTDNLTYLKAFAATGAGRPILKGYSANKAAADAPQTATPPVDAGDSGVRQFLDTCFMLGGWFDRYYDEIYKPAIKDAGFEPVRADDLFHTGAVVEQIWEQVRKAKILLADLTGKNANVFYELGLAHSISKPVVFVTGSIDDVPFDLRHLRVINYDTREPSWSDKLRKDIAAYLKNAKSSPAKSIPQPFRKAAQEDAEPEGTDEG